MLRQLFILLFFTVFTFAENNSSSKSIFSLIDVEFDPYYSNVGYYQSMTDAPIKDVGEMKELDLYKHLLFSYQKPEFFLIEASINPLPLLGVYMKKHQNPTYENAYLSDDFNYIKSLTAGFEEPYALSFFVGNFVTFTSPKQKRDTKNKGFFGYLLSVGDKHIKDNELIDDKWFEFEVKVKGDRNFDESKLGYSFRFGTKVHDHPNIKDIYYVGFRRSMTDFRHKDDFFKNFGFDLRSDFSYKDNDAIRHLLVFEKSFHYDRLDWAVTLKTGVLWENNTKYTGELQREAKESNYQFIIQPMIVF